MGHRTQSDHGSGRGHSPEGARFLGLSPGAQQVQRAIALAARVRSTVLVLGETGTGKEVVASAIHEASARQRESFIVVDCASIPRGLVEGELFGHTKGAFTSAVSSRGGAFAEAHRGTVFLDEIGELPLDLQPKLLRALSRKQIKPLGEARYVDVDVRVIAATNRDLWSEVEAGRFRADLYFRLAIFEIRVPPLRERIDDIPLLVESFGRALECPAPLLRQILARASTDALKRETWPGNARELYNYVERCVAYESVLDPTTRAAPPPQAGSASPPPALPSINLDLPLRQARESWNRTFERTYLDALLQQHEGNVRAAARRAGVDRPQLYRLLRKHAIR